jgi:hypothetical protein
MICVVSHDAGGAEVLASYIARQGTQCVFVLDGPAFSVFERRLGREIESVPIDEGIAQSDWLLCGTSWQSDLEWRAIGAGRRAGKRTIAFLDHWVHFRDRFVRQQTEHLPDEIWVGDAQGEALARQCFAGHSIRLVPNPYFQDIREAAASLGQGIPAAVDAGRGLRILFVCEPLSEHGSREFGNERHWGYTEFDALRYFFDHIKALGKTADHVVVRPHPAEPAGKYEWVADEFGAHVTIGGKKTLLQEIAESDVVVGCESMAMVVGLIVGRRVICCIPPGGSDCTLPQPEIESLQDLVESQCKATGMTQRARKDNSA